jgi:hypothetical protein
MKLFKSTNIGTLALSLWLANAGCENNYSRPYFIHKAAHSPDMSYTSDAEHWRTNAFMPDYGQIVYTSIRPCTNETTPHYQDTIKTSFILKSPDETKLEYTDIKEIFEKEGQRVETAITWNELLEEIPEEVIRYLLEY